MIVIGVTIAVMTSTPLALVPGITYAIAVGMAYMVYRHYLRVRRDGAATGEASKQNASFRMDVHPLLESGWEERWEMDVPQWLDMPASTFKVVGSRGICPKGLIQGDFVEVAASGAVTPGLCVEAEAVLRMAAEHALIVTVDENAVAGGAGSAVN